MILKVETPLDSVCLVRELFWGKFIAVTCVLPFRNDKLSLKTLKEYLKRLKQHYTENIKIKNRRQEIMLYVQKQVFCFNCNYKHSQKCQQKHVHHTIVLSFKLPSIKKKYLYFRYRSPSHWLPLSMPCLEVETAERAPLAVDMARYLIIM